MANLRQKIEPFIENIGEATAACLITMVQGNLLALTLGHWIMASQTGAIAGALTAAAILVSKIKQRWIVSSVLGAITAVVDFFIHPGQFGPIFLEAIVTGTGAACLCFLVGLIVDRVRARRSDVTVSSH